MTVIRQAESTPLEKLAGRLRYLLLRRPDGWTSTEELANEMQLRLLEVEAELYGLELVAEPVPPKSEARPVIDLTGQSGLAPRGPGAR